MRSPQLQAFCLLPQPYPNPRLWALWSLVGSPSLPASLPPVPSFQCPPTFSSLFPHLLCHLVLSLLIIFLSPSLSFFIFQDPNHPGLSWVWHLVDLSFPKWCECVLSSRFSGGLGDTQPRGLCGWDNWTFTCNRLKLGPYVTPYTIVNSK